uniref:Ig-like domain-containing protein n=1 Tax=Angiostrongylus cantonensis TaxID=6313 RepID=A0A0K0CZD4_ANGCA
MRHSARTPAMAKVEVQIRSCFCCGLSLATVFVAIYTLILYSLLTGLAAWGLSDTLNNGDSSHYRSCDLEAQGKLTAGDSENRKLTFHGGHTTVVVEDSTTYHCSFGLYTEELKYEAGLRYTTLVVNIFVYVCVVLASILMLIGLLIYNQWLLVPWMIIMAIDIIRGFISVLFIFIYSYVSCFHLSFYFYTNW